MEDPEADDEAFSTEDLEIDPCALECVGFDFDPRKINLKHLVPPKPPREFIVPIKVILRETCQTVYRKRAWGSAFLTFAYFAIGAMFMVIYCFTASFVLESHYNWHSFFYTLGVYLPLALLNKHSYNGATFAINPKSRKVDYFLLKLGCYVCVMIATANIMYIEGGKLFRWKYQTTYWFSLHAFLGMVALVLLPMDLAFLYCLPFKDKRLVTRIGMIFSLPSFGVSSLCFILGIMKKSFLTWLPKPIFPYLIISVLYYSFIASFDPLRNLMPLKPKKNTFYI